MWWPALSNKIKLNSLPVPKKHCFLSLSNFLFFPFSIISYSDLSSTQNLCPFTSKSKTKLKRWSLNTEDVRCQPSPFLKDQIRFLRGTCLLPIFPYLLHPKNSVIPVTNHSSDPQHMHTGICILIGLLCFQFLGTLVQ